MGVVMRRVQAHGLLELRFRLGVLLADIIDASQMVIPVGVFRIGFDRPPEGVFRGLVVFLFDVGQAFADVFVTAFGGTLG